MYSIKVGISFSDSGKGRKIAILDETGLGMFFFASELKLFVGGLKLAVELKIKDWERLLKVHDKLLFYFVKNVSFIFSNYIWRGYY